MKQIRQNQKGFIPLLALLAVGVLAVAGVVVFKMQKPDVAVEAVPAPKQQVSYQATQTDSEQPQDLNQSAQLSQDTVQTETTSNPSPSGSVLAAQDTIQPTISTTDIKTSVMAILQDPELKAQLTGPAGPQGPQGLAGASSSSSTGSSPIYIQPYIPTSPTSTNPGGTLAAFTYLSSDNFSTKDLSVSNNATVTGNTTVGGTLAVTGATTVSGALNVTGTISGTVNPSFTSGSVVFQGTSGLAQDNTNFFFNDTKNILGVGTATPTAKLSIVGSSNSGTGTITSSSGTTVTGTSTLFTTELTVGDEITVNGQTRTVATIVSDTSLTTTVAFNPVISGTAAVAYEAGNSVNTGSTESNTLSWTQTVDGTSGNRLLVVYVAIHKNAALTLPTVITVTYGNQTLTSTNSTTLQGSTVRLVSYRIVNPSPGSNTVTVTLASGATARMIGHSQVFNNVRQSAPTSSSQAGGGSGNMAMFGSPGAGKMMTSFGVFESDHIATPDYTYGLYTETLNETTGATADDVSAAAGFSNDSSLSGGYYMEWILSGPDQYPLHAELYNVLNPINTGIGAFTYRSPLSVLKDSSSIEQITISAGGQAAFHRGLSVDITGGTSDYSAIFNGGSVGIGTTAPSYSLDVQTDIATSYIANFFNDGNTASRYGIQIQGGADDASGTTYYLNALDGDGTQVGYIANTAGTFALTDVSDIRTKTNIQDTQVEGLQTLLGLRVVDFNRVANPDGPLLTGFIAQEVQEVYPNIITEGANGYLGITKENLIPVIVKAIQEQQSQINILIDPDSQLQGNLAGNLSSSLTITPKSQLYLSKDSAGRGKILPGSKTVRISFSKPYEYQPIVTATPIDFTSTSYRITDTDLTGFTIELEDEEDISITFNWHSFTSSGAKLSVSDGTTEDISIIMTNSLPITIPEDQPQEQEESAVPDPVEVTEDGEEETVTEESNSLQEPEVILETTPSSPPETPVLEEVVE
jgi:hypothetical protein